jgi:hypothetical protein
MNARAIALALALTPALVAPLAASAAPPDRQSGPAQRQPAPQRAVLVGQPAGNRPTAPVANRGFNLRQDTGPMTRTAPVARIAPRPGTIYRPLPGNVRAPVIGRVPPATPRGGWPNPHARGYVVVNRGYRGNAWGWNAGNAWAPHEDYWGGGFWGPFAFGSLGVATLIFSSQQSSLPYYQVATSSPGAELLSDYDLAQTPCGPPDLVVIDGPDAGTICAYPNANVGPGTYGIDESTLTLVSN